MKYPIQVLLSGLLLASLAVGQSAYLQLTPGKDSRSDASRVLGEPVKNHSETMSEYLAKNTGQKLYVQFREENGVIERIEVLFGEPVSRSTLSGMLGLPVKADAVKYNAEGRMEEYFGTNKMIVLIHRTSDVASPVIRAGYYSAELFAEAMKLPVGTPKASPVAPPRTAAIGGNKAEPRSFKDVDLLVPKGDKSESKSVRLLFDGQDIVIDTDRGEKIYKQIPYQAIVSGEYSYSKKPLWKTAIIATILIGVFALPLFFMKSKQHWLTIQTGNDFANLRLDKNNYRMILATFETTTGRKVETVADNK